MTTRTRRVSRRPLPDERSGASEYGVGVGLSEQREPVTEDTDDQDERGEPDGPPNQQATANMTV